MSEQTLTRPHSLKNKSFKGGNTNAEEILCCICYVYFINLTLAACGGGSSDSGDKGESSSSGGDKPKFLSLLTGGTSGTYYPLGGEIAKIYY